MTDLRLPQTLSELCASGRRRDRTHHGTYGFVYTRDIYVYSIYGFGHPHGIYSLEHTVERLVPLSRRRTCAASEPSRRRQPGGDLPGPALEESEADEAAPWKARDAREQLLWNMLSATANGDAVRSYSRRGDAARSCWWRWLRCSLRP